MATKRKPDVFPDRAYLERGLREGWITIQIVSMKAIVADSAYQARVGQHNGKHIDMDHVKRLASIRDLQNGDSLHPIVVFFLSDGKYIMADGFHRHEENRLRREPAINAYVCKVDHPEREALLYAAMCNRETLLQRSTADIRKAVMMLLSDEQCFRWTDERIANHAGSSPRTVKKYRIEFCNENKTRLPKTVVSPEGEEKPYNKKRKSKIMLISEENFGKRKHEGMYLGLEREKKGFSRETVAEAVGIKVENLDEFERGLRVLAPASIMKIQEFLNATLSDESLFSISLPDLKKHLDYQKIESHWISVPNMFFKGLRIARKSRPHILVIISYFDRQNSLSEALGDLELIRALNSEKHYIEKVIIKHNSSKSKLPKILELTPLILRDLNVEILTVKDLLAKIHEEDKAS